MSCIPSYPPTAMKFGRSFGYAFSYAATNALFSGDWCAAA